MVLLMIVSALAGCTSGDPDGDGELGIDPDLLDELIESNLQDFINNTTVTVNNHHHYNSTNSNVVNQGNSSINSLYTIHGMEKGNDSYDITSEDHYEMIVRTDVYSDESSLDGVQICLKIGGDVEAALIQHNEFGFTSVSVADISEMSTKIIDGSCDAAAAKGWEISPIHDNMQSAGIDFWYYSDYFGGEVDGSEIYSNLNIQITQNSGEVVYIRSLYGSISLNGECVDLGCDSSIIIPEVSYIVETNADLSLVTHQGQPTSYYMNPDWTVQYNCEDNISKTITYLIDFRPIVFAAGLECEININLEVSFNEDIDYLNAPYDDPAYDFNWSDWSYFVHYSNAPVTIVE